MNKKGGLGIFVYVCLLVLLAVAIAVNSGNFNVDTFNSNLNWTNVHTPIENAPELGNALESLVNGIGEAWFSIMKWVAKWSAENPTIPFKLLFWFVFISLIIPILYYLTLFIIVIVILIIEWIKSSREKREIKELKRRKLERMYKRRIE